MNLSKEDLMMYQKSFDLYYIEYCPVDGITPSAEGYVSLTFEDDTDPHCTGVDIDLSEVKVFAHEGYQDICNTEEGDYFLEHLKDLISVSI